MLGHLVIFLLKPAQAARCFMDGYLNESREAIGLVVLMCC
jgi:hypothetical protein